MMRLIMNLISLSNKTLITLSFLIAILPISLLTGSFIINLITITITIIFILELLIKKKINFLHDWSFYLLIFLWVSFLINVIFSQDSSLSIFRAVGFIRFIFLAQVIRYLFLTSDTKYKELMRYNDERYKVELNLKTNSIISKDMYFTNPSCHYQRKLGEFEEHISCAQSGYFFTLNLTNFKYTFANGFGYVVSDTDDLAIRYGTCEEF